MEDNPSKQFTSLQTSLDVSQRRKLISVGKLYLLVKSGRSGVKLSRVDKRFNFKRSRSIREQARARMVRN